MSEDEITVNDLDNGLYYIENIIDNSTELITNLDECTWKPLTTSVNSRKVQHYGFLYDYKTYRIDIPGPELPLFLINIRDILTDVCKQLGLIDDTYVFNQCIVNNYTLGQSISSHVDVKRYGKVIGCYTIGSEAIMRFMKSDKKIELNTAPNSLYIMSGDIRYNWTHEMLKLKSGRRISITFRNVN